MAPDTPRVITLDRIYEIVVEVKALVTSVDSRVRVLDSTVSRLDSTVARLDGTVNRLDREMAVINDWRKSQVNHTLQDMDKDVGDLKVQVAKIVAGGGSVGVGFGAVVAILKLTGVL
jgi:archaellum component FlaC